MLWPSQWPRHVPDQAFTLGRWHPLRALAGLHGGPLPPPGPAPGLPGEILGWGCGLGPGESTRTHPSILCFCRSHRLVAGVPGDHGATALGAAGAVSTSPPGTALGLCPGTGASTVKAAVPASAPAAPRSALLAQVRHGGREPYEGVVGRMECPLSAGVEEVLSLQWRGVTLPFRNLPRHSVGDTGAAV